MSTWVSTLSSRAKRSEPAVSRVRIQPRVVDGFLLGVMVVVLALAWRPDAEPTAMAELVPTARKALEQHVKGASSSEGPVLAELSARP